MAELVDDVPTRALAIYAHPDDPEVSCGGTLARWAAAGSEIHIVLCCRGDKGSSDASADPVELAERRSEEAARAARVLGVAAHHVLGYADGALDDSQELRARLVGLIRQLTPEMVVCPDPTAVFFGQSYINHRDHRVVGWATLDAVAPAAWSPLYFPEAGTPHRVSSMLLSGTMEPDAWVDVSAHIEVKAEALLCHGTQLGEGGEWLRTVVRDRAAEAGRSAGVPYAEGFRLLHPA